jgi:hypothetical protein
VGEQISVNMLVVALEMFLHTCNVLVKQLARNIGVAQLAFLDQVRENLGQFGDLMILLVQQVQRQHDGNPPSMNGCGNTGIFFGSKPAGFLTETDGLASSRVAENANAPTGLPTYGR